MRLEKMYGLLMKALLAVLMLFVTAAAVEVSNDIELEKAINEKCDTITLMPYEYEYYLDLDEPIEINFDMVLDLGGNELVTYFRITKGAKVTIKNGELNASGDPILEVCGNSDEKSPTTLILTDNLRLTASNGILIDSSNGYSRVELDETTISCVSRNSNCIRVYGHSNQDASTVVSIDRSNLYSRNDYVIDCDGDTEISISDSTIIGAGCILLQGGEISVSNSILDAFLEFEYEDSPIGAIAFMPATGAVRVILTLGPGNQISSKSGAIFYIVPAAQGSVTAQIAITGGTFITENGHPLFSAPEEIGKIVGISGGSFPGISPEESAALAPCLNESLTVDKDGNVAAKPQEAGVIIVQTDEEDRTQSNPSTGAPVNTIGQWILSIVFRMLSEAR
mgnify:CR=1 FL=1